MGSSVAVIIPRPGVARTEVIRAAWAPWLAAVPDEPPDGRAENYDEEDHEIDCVFAHAISRSAYYRTENRIHCRTTAFTGQAPTRAGLNCAPTMASAAASAKSC